MAMIAAKAFPVSEGVGGHKKKSVAATHFPMVSMHAIPAHHEPIAVMLDLVNPVRAGRRLGDPRRLAWFDEAGGTPSQDHGGRMGQRHRDIQLPARLPVCDNAVASPQQLETRS